MVSKIDKRRLADGARAITIEPASGQAELELQIESLNDAIRAMQSLDNLGSPEANRRAWADMTRLQKKRDECMAILNG